MAKKRRYALGLGMAGLAILTAPLASGISQSASAACALQWEMTNNGKTETVSACDGKAGDGAFVSKITDDQMMVVDLNNYKGAAFTLVNSGTGVAFGKIVINLTGENEVQAEDGIAFNAGAPLEFTGEGSLRIKALVPIMNGGVYTTKDYQVVTVPEILKQYIPDWSQKDSYLSDITIKSTTIVEKPTEKPNEETDEKPEETEKEDEKPGNETDCANANTSGGEAENPWTWGMITAHVAAGIYIILSLVTFILLGIRKMMRRREPKETKKIIIERNGEKVTEEAEETEKE